MDLYQGNDRCYPTTPVQTFWLRTETERHRNVALARCPFGTIGNEVLSESVVGVGRPPCECNLLHCSDERWIKYILRNA